MRNDTLTGLDVNESKLGKVPSAGTADSAANAANAANAARAANAANAAAVGGFLEGTAIAPDGTEIVGSELYAGLNGFNAPGSCRFGGLSTIG